MLTLQRILVPVDFSENSLAAAEHGVVLANHFGAELTFLHVMPAPPASDTGLAAHYYTTEAWLSEPEMERQLTTVMESLVEKVSGGRTIGKLVVKGDPAHRIVKVIQDSGVDLVIMPTHGYGPFRRFLLGSVTAKVLHDTCCPVFTGAHVAEVQPYKGSPYHRLACAIDLSDHSEAVLRWAWGLAQSWDLQMVVLHAAPPPQVNMGYGEFMVPETQRFVVAEAKEKASKLVEQVGCQAELVVEPAEVVDFVCGSVKATGSDLLVVGRSVKPGRLGRLRTHSYNLIREAPCPVISV